MSIKINGEEHQFLYEQIKSAQNVGLNIEELDAEIVNGLNQNKVLRNYQVEALKYTNHYYKNLLRDKQLHLLYNMATGSGKTLIMAYLILYFYKKGYNTFVFFVNNTNIVEKTKDNFLKKGSSKYLFNNPIMINGNNVKINEIKTFEDIEKDQINIMFTTVQSLHDNLKITRENQIALEDFENNKVVLLADEAHHLNAGTKSKSSESEKMCWEYTIKQILLSNKKSMLLEFTATPDFKNEDVVMQYVDHVIYNYDLLSFRKDGYTKDFDNYESTNDDMHRLLLALLMSQYRKKLFAKHKLDVKPVVLAKSKITDEKNEFIERYLRFINKDIKEDDIAQLEISAEGHVAEMFKFYKKENISYNNLIEELRLDFSKDHIISLDSSMSEIELEEKNRLVNSLEDVDNPYRLIFVVEMLHEGWDVLNLYDIVRLYEERDSGRKIGKSTTQEAQLVGRGVRYYPFSLNKEQEYIFNKRKYDGELDNEMRICETLLFHSKTDSKYLYELREALKQQGMDTEDKIKFCYKVKDSFKMTNIYRDGVIFINKQLEYENIEETIPKSFEFMFTKNFIRSDIQASLAEEDKIVVTKKSKIYTYNFKIKEYAKENYAVVYKAMRTAFISFDKLKQYIPAIKSNKDFILNDKYIGKYDITIQTDKEEVSVDEYYKTLIEFFYILKKKFEAWKDNNKGTKQFYQVKISEFVKDTPREKINPDKYGEGISQNADIMPEKYKLDLSDCDWFVYNDNYGTTEEKSFVKFLAPIIEKIKQKYKQVYLIRNERNLHIYSFDDGKRFEPDYILLLQNEKDNGTVQKQIFIEAKGTQFLKEDEWKEAFLKQIEEEAKIVAYEFQKNHEYSVLGLPFYNEENEQYIFKEALEKAVEKEYMQETILEKNFDVI